MPSPQQTFQTLVQELSASGDTPLLSPTGVKLTLRQAIGWVLTKTTEVLGLTDRPVPPELADDLYGHILSMRAEGLITQAIVAQIATKLGIDVPTIQNAAIASFSDVQAK